MSYGILLSGSTSRWLPAGSGRRGQLGRRLLGGEVHRLAGLTETLPAGVQEGVQDEPPQDHDEGLVDDLVPRGERHPHREQDAHPGDREVACELPALDAPTA